MSAAAGVERRGQRVLISGISTRAAAESAARAGFPVTTLDAFGDLDQHPGVNALSMPRDFARPFTAPAAARASVDLAGDAVVYLSPFENHPRAVEALARGRALWGNPPAVLRRARDPFEVARVLRSRGLPSLRVETAPIDAASSWILKPLRSGGGHGVRRWHPGEAVPRSSYLQEWATGIPGSVVFVAHGGRAVPLGMSRQLVGDAVFGPRPAGLPDDHRFRYCGNIMRRPTGADPLSDAAGMLVRALAEELDLVGLNAIDFVAVGAVPYVTEINPRWSGSMELLERAGGPPLFDAHARACADGTLPAPYPWTGPPAGRAVGKAIVFARRTVVVGDTRAWLSDPSVRDVPHPGERIVAGHPVCTVFASGDDDASCYEALVRRAEQVYDTLRE
jgi:predicted ATP-grasp superfamily ATP-dependent carboligase